MKPNESSLRITKLNLIKTERFDLRDLTEMDASIEYLSWLSDPNTKRFISAAKKTQNLAELKNFIRERTDSDFVRFFGIFERATNKHIGNIKYEPIDTKLRYAIMGVLIGDPLFRGVGVFGEVYPATSRYIRDTYNLSNIFLGVDYHNSAAIKSYEKVGFLETERHPLNKIHSRIVMVHSLQPVQPEL